MGRAVLIDSVRYAEHGGHYSYLHLADGAAVKMRITDERLREILTPQRGFAVAARGLFVNLREIEETAPGCVVLKDGERLPVSKRRRKGLADEWRAFMSEKGETVWAR